MKSFRGVGLVVVGVLSASYVNAAEYSVTPSATAKAEFNTNRRLSSANEESNFGQVFDAGALFQYQSDETALSITPRISVQRYGDDGSDIDQDRQNYYVQGNAQHRFNERWSGGATMDYSNSGVVASELDDEGIIIEDVDESFTRETISFGPSMTYILSERNSLRFGAGFTEATYDNNNTQLSDYSNFSINGAWIHQLTETNQVIFSVFGSIQDPELNNQVLRSAGSGMTADLPTGANPHDVPDPSSLLHKFEQFGANIQYTHSFTPTLTGMFTVGMRSTNGDFPDLVDFDVALGETATNYLSDPGNIDSTNFYFGRNTLNRLDPLFDDAAFLTLYNQATNESFTQGSRRTNLVYDQGRVSNTGILFDLSLEKQYERTTYTARVSRASIPTGTGLTERDEFSLFATHVISDRMSGRGSFRYFSTQNESEQTLSQDGGSTDQIRLEAGVDYRLTEFWTLAGGYEYRHRSPEVGDSADGHLVFVSIGYNGRRYSMSR